MKKDAISSALPSLNRPSSKSLLTPFSPDELSLNTSSARYGARSNSLAVVRALTVRPMARRILSHPEAQLIDAIDDSGEANGVSPSPIVPVELMLAIEERPGVGGERNEQVIVGGGEVRERADAGGTDERDAAIASAG